MEESTKDTAAMLRWESVGGVVTVDDEFAGFDGAELSPLVVASVDAFFW
jgi:hypothetical protein